jgi:hypothetical protein
LGGCGVVVDHVARSTKTFLTGSVETSRGITAANVASLEVVARARSTSGSIGTLVNILALNGSPFSVLQTEGCLRSIATVAGYRCHRSSVVLVAEGHTGPVRGREIEVTTPIADSLALSCSHRSLVHKVTTVVGGVFNAGDVVGLRRFKSKLAVQLRHSTKGSGRGSLSILHARAVAGDLGTGGGHTRVIDKREECASPANTVIAHRGDCTGNGKSSITGHFNSVPKPVTVAVK